MEKKQPTFGTIRVQTNGGRTPVAMLGFVEIPAQQETNDPFYGVTLSRVHSNDTFSKDEGKRRLTAKFSSVGDYFSDQFFSVSDVVDLEEEDGQTGIAYLLQGKIITCRKSQLSLIRRKLTYLLSNKSERFRLFRNLGE